MKFLFHYTNATALAGILTTGTLWMSSLRRLNDPREAKDLEFGYGGMAGNAPVRERQEKISAEVNRRLREQVFVACFTAEGDEYGEWGHYSRGYGRARNWAQYGDDHAGACIVFDRAELEKAFDEAAKKLGSTPRHFCGPVVYRDQQAHHDPVIGWTVKLAELREIGIEGVLDRWIEKAHESLFFWKNTDWASEQEYRLVALAEDATRVEIDVRSSIVGLVLGERFPDAEASVLGERLRRIGVEALQLGKMTWRNGMPGCYVPYPLEGFELLEGDSELEWGRRLVPVPVTEPGSESSTS